MIPVLFRKGDNTYHTSSYCSKVAGYSDGDSANPTRLDDVYVSSAESLRKRNMKPCKRDACITMPSFDISELAFLKGFE